MALTGDKSLDALHADWLAKTDLAAKADQALQSAVGGIAVLRLASQAAAQEARRAAQALYSEVFTGSSVTAQQAANWVRVGGTSMRDALDPALIADCVFTSITGVASAPVTDKNGKQ